MRRRHHGIALRVVLGMGCVLGLAMAMTEPWYGSPRPVTAEDAMSLALPLEGMAAELSRWMGERDGTSAWQAFEGTDGLLAILLVVAGTAVLGCLVPAVEREARAALRISALGTVGLVAIKLVDHPGADAASEPRYGLLLALTLAMGLLACAGGILSSPLQRRRRAPLEPL